MVAEDPVFGRICYGGILSRGKGGIQVRCRDGVGRRFHYIGEKRRFHAECVHGAWAEEGGIRIDEDWSRVILRAESGAWKKESLSVRIMAEGMGDYRIGGTDNMLRDGAWLEIAASEDPVVLEKV